MNKLGSSVAEIFLAQLLGKSCHALTTCFKYDYAHEIFAAPQPEPENSHFRCTNRTARGDSNQQIQLKKKKRTKNKTTKQNTTIFTIRGTVFFIRGTLCLWKFFSIYKLSETVTEHKTSINSKQQQNKKETIKKNHTHFI